MNGDFPLTLGRLAFSKAGRDKGRFYLIVASEGEHVMLCDGKTREIKRPKRKKLKHVRLKPQVCEDIMHKLDQGAAVYDQDIRQAIAGFVSKMERPQTNAE